MNILGRINNQTLIEPQPTQDALQAAELEVMEHRFAQLPDEIVLAKGDVQALATRRQAIATIVAKLTEQAGAGMLEDASRLVDALRQQRELAADNFAVQRLESLQAELTSLQNRIHERRRIVATETYQEAVQHYARACAPLPTLSLRVAEAAKAAGILLSQHNSPHLIGRDIQIGGALIAIPPQQDV